MKKVKVGRFKHLKDSNETKDTEDDSLLTTQQVINSHTLNTPLIEPTETKVDIQQTLSGGTMSNNYNQRLSTKEKLMQQAGIGKVFKAKESGAFAYMENTVVDIYIPLYLKHPNKSFF